MKNPMAVYSMTGYATAHAAAALHGADAPGTPALGLEIRSVNSRFLDLSFRMSDELRGAEPALRDRLQARIKRGKVEVRAWVEGREAGALSAPADAELQRLLVLQEQVRTWLPGAAPLTVADVLQLKARQPLPTAGLADTLLAVADGAIESFLASRAREGERLAASLTERTAALRALAAQAQPLVPALVEQQRQRFIERWNEALGTVDGAPAPESVRDRALAEAAAFAIRIDVAEEITRLHAHLDEIDRLLTQGKELGKRLDFLIQELHREANTLGSKSSSLDLTRIAVDMKVLIEQMREQVQNLE